MKNKSVRAEKKSFWQFGLRYGYVVALSIIFVVAILKYNTSEHLIYGQDKAAVVINMSGKQRMLSQRAAFFATSYMYAENGRQRAEISPKLRKTAAEFKQNHTDLIKGSLVKQLPKVTNKDVLAIYFEGDDNLDELMTQYLSAIDIVIDSKSSDIEQKNALQYIQDVGPNILLEKLDKVVELHETTARKDVIQLSEYQKLFLIITIVVLLLEGLLLFRPMVRRIERNILDLEKREIKINDQYQELKRFTYIASHDLQEPLRKVVSFTERLRIELQNRKTDDKIDAYMNFISTGATHMRELVQGLYAYARISGSDEKIEEIDSGIVLEQVLKGIAPKIEETKAKIQYGNLPKILYNEEMFRQIFSDLIGNAIKYKGVKAPQIDVSALDQKDMWVFCVADNGLGIEEKYFDKIFEMFQRLHRKEDISGTGLGLALVKKIVEKHGGRIWVKSDRGDGSEFYFSVPKKRKEIV